MTCPFRYVQQDLSSSVTLHLFKTLNGSHRANVKGPADTQFDGLGSIFELKVCMPLGDAFASGIRMANRHDVPLVIRGDRSLWNPQWGSLAS